MNPLNRKKPVGACIGLLLGAAGVLAQNVPDAGSLIRDSAASANVIRPAATLPPVLLSGDEKTQAPGLKIGVKGFLIRGATLLPDAELQALLTDLVGKELSLAQLQQGALRISNFYRQRGYFARALLPKQEVKDGLVEILVLESTLGGVEVDEPIPPRTRPELAKNMVLSQQKIGQPLRPDDVLSGLKLLNETPGYSVSATLRPGAQERESNLHISLQESPLVSGIAMLDNQGSKATGAERVLGLINLNNPSGWGDQASLMVLAGEGSDVVRGAYTIGLGYSGLRAGVNATALNYKLIGSLSALQVKGSAALYGLTVAYPLVRSSAANLNLGAALDHKRFINDANTINISDKTLKTLGLTLSGDYLDAMAGGGLSQFSLSITGGNADLAGNAFDQALDLATMGTQGDYQKLSFSLSRLQKLTDKTGAFVGLSGQFASKTLDSSEKFSLGGPNGIRAFPLGEGSGDQGWLLVSELRYNLTDSHQLFGFVDVGGLTLFKSTWNGWDAANPGLLNSFNLSGAGVGLNWSSKSNFMLRSIVSKRLVNNPASDANGNDSDGSLQQYRVWLQLIKPF